MRELKVGDRVMLRSDLVDNHIEYGYCFWKKRMKKGEIVTIRSISPKFFKIKDDGIYNYTIAMIDYIIGEKEMTRDDLKTGDFILYGIGWFQLLKDTAKGDIVISMGDCNIWDSLRCDGIKEVRRPDYGYEFNPSLSNVKSSKVIWERTEAKEHTMAEVNAKFGYDVKIVKE